MGNKFLNCTALTIAIIGAINWGLIGIFRFDLVAFIFGEMSWLSRIIYTIVGLCGLYLITFYMRCILRPPAATIPFWSGRFTEQNGRIVTIDYSLFLS